MSEAASNEGGRATQIRYSLMELAGTLSGVISLGRGDPDLDTPAPIIDGALRRLATPVERQDIRGWGRLRRALADRYVRDKNLHIDPDREVLVTNGAQEGLFLAVLSLLNPGDRVLVPDPRYSSYDQAIEAAGAVSVVVPTGRNRDFRLNADDLSSRARGAKLLVFINPSNPTCALVPPTEVRRIAAVAREANLLVISDEIYENLVFDDQAVLSMAACDGMRDRTVTLSGFSKTYAMTGFRVGYLIGPAAFIEAASRLKAVTSGPCPWFSQYAALAALEQPDEVALAFRACFGRRRQVMMDGLDRMSIPYGHPGGGFFIWADISRFGLEAQEFCRRLLVDARVLMFPGTSFGEGWQGYVRISLLQPEERLVEAVDRLRRFVGSMGTG